MKNQISQSDIPGPIAVLIIIALIIAAAWVTNGAGFCPKADAQLESTTQTP